MSVLRSPFLGGSFLGRHFLGWKPGILAPPPAPVVPTNEVVNWLAVRLGLPIYLNHLPQDGDDAVAFGYTLVGGSTLQDLRGATRFRRIRIQLDAWSKDAPEVFAAQEKLANLLGNYRGPMGKVFCQVATPGQPLTAYFSDPGSSDRGFHRYSCDWEFSLNV